MSTAWEYVLDELRVMLNSHVFRFLRKRNNNVCYTISFLRLEGGFELKKGHEVYS